MANHLPVHMNLDNLLSRYLDRQAEAHAEGVESREGEVTAYDAGPVQPIDAKLAWDETRSVLSLYGLKSEKPISAPPGWSTLVAEHEPVVALPIAVGNFPQLVRNFHALLQDSGVDVWPKHPRPVDVPGLKDWAWKSEGVGMLTALGMLRLAKQFAWADDFVSARSGSVPTHLADAWANEKATLAWHRGDRADALAQWAALDATPIVNFNRGMASMFLNRGPAARAELEAGLSRLPESGAWQFLGRLYLTMR